MILPFACDRWLRICVCLLVRIEEANVKLNLWVGTPIHHRLPFNEYHPAILVISQPI